MVGKERIIKTNFLDCETGLLDTEVSILCDSILCDSIICDQSSVYHNRRLKSVLHSQILISFSHVILYKKEQSVATASVFKTHGSRVKKSSLSKKDELDLCIILEAKLEARVRALRPLATCCSDREVHILASAVEELWVSRKVDAMKDLVLIQVETGLLSGTHKNNKNCSILLEFSTIGCIIILLPTEL